MVMPLGVSRGVSRVLWGSQETALWNLTSPHVWNLTSPHVLKLSVLFGIFVFSLAHERSALVFRASLKTQVLIGFELLLGCLVVVSVGSSWEIGGQEGFVLV